MCRCQSCSLVFTYPQPLKKAVTSHNTEVFNSEKELLGRTSIFEKEYARAQKHVREVMRFKPGGKLLDIGCSYGILVKAAKDLGFDARGVEPTKRAASYAAKRLHLSVIHGTVETASFAKNSFDVITLYDVLEHIPDFKKFLKEIRRILKSDGILVIQSPNVDSFAFRLLKTRWNWLLVPQHLWHFSGRSLTHVLADAGFSVIWKTTEDNPYDFASNLKSTLSVRGVRYAVYLAVYGAIAAGTKIWSRMGRGGLIRVYAEKT